MKTAAYSDFVEGKKHSGAEQGFDPLWLPDSLFDFQREMVEWSLRRGRAALFEDCGMGKTLQLLVWAANVAEHTGDRVLILSPLAVAPQTVREAQKFDISVEHSRDGTFDADLVITNYERLHYFNPHDFVGVVCDESSILKSFDGARKTEITTFMRKVPYRLLCTATAAPNDYHELGTSSEALGYMGYTDMLHRFFINDQNNNNGRRMFGEQPKWRFKGHAELPFWRWVSGWARAIRKPSDLGFSDEDFDLPPLTVRKHEAGEIFEDDERLFTVPAATLAEQRREKRKTLEDRCQLAADLVNETGESALVWCQLNDEGDLLETLIPDSVQVSGTDSDDRKEAKFLDFIDGSSRVLITKPKIGAWGLNFQHCRHVTYFPSHSYEQYYQAIRRCWRFGQEREVLVDVIYSEGEAKILQNLERKAAAADQMFENLVAEMNNAVKLDTPTDRTKRVEVPEWL